MTATAPTVTDLFCGAGGSSLGAEAAGMTIEMAANHWTVAIDVHQVHFPEARHDCADISAADPRRYPSTNVLLASPECTNHSQARGVSRKRQDASLFDQDFDPAAEKSRATMWDVIRFAEQISYDAIVVENVVEATKWRFWPQWLSSMTDGLGYRYRILSHNSMHHGVAQSRDRIYIVFTRPGLDVNLEMEVEAECRRCQAVTVARQAWKNGRTVGRYRQQWTWNCVACNTVVEPATRGAVEIIDWSLPCPRIGDRAKPLVDKTRARIAAGLQRYGFAPIITAGAGNTFERTPGNRARPVTDPLPVQQTTATQALATAPGWLVRSNNPEGGDPGRHVTPISEPARTMTTVPGQYLLMNTAHGGRVHDPDKPHPTVCASDDRMSLIVPLRNNGKASSTDAPIPTATAGGNHHGLVMRHNGGGPEMVTPLAEPVRTMTTAGHQSLLMPYYGEGQCQLTTRPAMTQGTRDTAALVDVGRDPWAELDVLAELERIVDDCGFRMLEPHEIAAAMAFPPGYIPTALPKRSRVKLAGNAVTPPVMQWICGRIIQALEAAA